jgi:hypothetical protein
MCRARYVKPLWDILPEETVEGMETLEIQAIEGRFHDEEYQVRLADNIYDTDTEIDSDDAASIADSGVTRLSDSYYQSILDDGSSADELDRTQDETDTWSEDEDSLRIRSNFTYWLERRVNGDAQAVDVLNSLQCNESMPDSP